MTLDSGEVDPQAFYAALRAHYASHRVPVITRQAGEAIAIGVPHSYADGPEIVRLGRCHGITPECFFYEGVFYTTASDASDLIQNGTVLLDLPAHLLQSAAAQAQECMRETSGLLRLLTGRL